MLVSYAFEEGGEGTSGNYCHQSVGQINQSMVDHALSCRDLKILHDFGVSMMEFFPVDH